MLSRSRFSTVPRWTIAQRSLIHDTLEVRALLLIRWKSHPGCGGPGEWERQDAKERGAFCKERHQRRDETTPPKKRQIEGMRIWEEFDESKDDERREKSQTLGGERSENGREEAEQRRRGAVIHRQASRHMASLCGPLVGSQEECLVTRWCCMSQPKWGNRDAGAAESCGSSFCRLSLMSRQLKCSNNRGRPKKKTFFSKAQCAKCRGQNVKICLWVIYSRQLLPFHLLVIYKGTCIYIKSRSTSAPATLTTSWNEKMAFDVRAVS